LCVGLLLAVLGHSSPRAMGASDEYRLGAGDVIDVFVWKEKDLSESVVIRPDGNVSLPLLGEVSVEGRTASEVQQMLTDRLRKYLVQPFVSIVVKEINSPKIFVLGKVRKPDAYLIKSNITLLDAIALAGGIRDDAKGDRVLILRNVRSANTRANSAKRQRIELDLKRLISNPDSGRIRLLPFDTVYVP
jgi:polysaccharide export outer membrane protein